MPERRHDQAVVDVTAPAIDTNCIPLSDRCALLQRAPACANLPPEAIQTLAGVLAEETYAVGDVIATPDDVGDRVYLIVDGRAEATVTTPSGPSPIAVLSAGELFGEIAPNQSDHLRTATVTAVTPVQTLSLKLADFQKVLDSYPAARAALENATDFLLVASFLKQASPFACLDVDSVTRLAEHLQPLHVGADEVIIRQGDTGDRCYLLHTGEMQVLMATDGGDTQQLATLKPGSIVGELALLTDSRRNATVKATAPCDLLTLSRADLREVVQEDRDLAKEMLDVIQMRDRPTRIPGVISVQRSLADGTEVTTLKDPARAAYYRLTPEGYYIWQQLDGEHTLRDIALGYLTTFKSFAPQAIADTISGLAAAGFVQMPSLTVKTPGDTVKPSRLDRMTAGARAIMEWETSLPDPDRALGRIYSGGVRWIYTRLGQIILALLFVSGLGVFLTHFSQARNAHITGAWIILSLFLTYGFSVVIHELGHGFTVKAFGYQVSRAGVGWYWFGPIAFVDTSDMWMAPRKEGILVSLGGPYTSALVGSVSAIGAVLLGPTLPAAVLWQLSFFSFYVTLLNLNPLMELDGYYVLIDWLERPNLRRNCLAWLGNELPRAIRNRRELAAHRIEVLYGLGAIVYILFSSYLMLAVYRPVIQGWLHAFLPLTVAVVLAWLVAVGLVLAALLTLAGDIGSVRQAKQ